MRGPLTEPRDFNLLHRAPLVRAYLAAMKTQTRRIMHPQPVWRDDAWYWRSPRYNNGDGVSYFHTTDVEGVRAAWSRANPYGPPGSTMHVRESVWRDDREPDACAIYAATPEIARYNRPLSDRAERAERKRHEGMIFATYQEQGTHRCTRADSRSNLASNPFWRLRPSIHMPAWACRITATLASVHPEQVMYIDDKSARAEGIPQTAGEAKALGLFDLEHHHEWDNHRSSENFLRLFYGINERRLSDVIPGNQNPWVWALTFSDVVVDMPQYAPLPYIVWDDTQHAQPQPNIRP